MTGAVVFLFFAWVVGCIGIARSAIGTGWRIAFCLLLGVSLAGVRYWTAPAPIPLAPIRDPEAIMQPPHAKPEPAKRETRQPENAKREEMLPPSRSDTQPPKNADAGLAFHEVSPENFGFTKTVPNTFTIDFGGNAAEFNTQLLKKQVPFDRLWPIKIGGDLPLKIYFDNNSNIKVDATVYDNYKNIAAIIKRNDFSVINRAWDRNWDNTAFEIVDEQHNTIFQIERSKWNYIKIRGIFINSTGNVLIVTDRSITVNPRKPVPTPRRLFRYPGNVYLNQRL
jgi:hypothetical protein